MAQIEITDMDDPKEDEMLYADLDEEEEMLNLELAKLELPKTDDNESRGRVSVNNYRFHSRYYIILKCTIAFLMGYGTRLKHCLRSDDNYKTSIDKCKIFWNIYQIFCIFIIHLSLIANISTIIYVHYFEERRLQSYSLSTILILCNITAIFAIDVAFYYRKLRSNLINDICDENFIFDSIRETKSCLLNTFSRFVHSSHLAILESKEHSLTTFLIQTFIIPVICYAYFFLSLCYYIFYSKWASIERSFFHLNMILIFFAILHHIVICILLKLKFACLNTHIKTLKDGENPRIDELKFIIKW